MQELDKRFYEDKGFGVVPTNCLPLEFIDVLNYFFFIVADSVDME